MIDKDFTSDAKSCEYDAVYPKDASNIELWGMASKIIYSSKKN